MFVNVGRISKEAITNIRLLPDARPYDDDGVTSFRLADFTDLSGATPPVVLKQYTIESLDDRRNYDVCQDRAMREYTMLARFKGQNGFVHTYGYVDDAPLVLWIVLEYVPRQHLSWVTPRPSCTQRCRLLASVIDALCLLHVRGLRAETMCPSHVLCADDGTVKLTGFSRDGMHAVTHYTAPELSCDFLEHTEKADVYSFGVLFGAVLTWSDPPQRFTRGGSNDKRQLNLWLTGVPCEAVTIIERALFEAPRDRPSLSDFQKLITRLVDEHWTIVTRDVYTM